MTPQFVRTILSTTISATLLLPTTLLGAGCGQAEPEATNALGASLTQLAKPTPSGRATPAPAPTVAPTRGKAPQARIDMSYLFKGGAADRSKLQIASFKADMTDEQKREVVKNISKVLERMQADDTRERITEMPRAVRDGAAIWNQLTDLEKLKYLEEENQEPDPGGDVSNWAAAAVGVAVAALAYEVAKDEKWINDKDLKELDIRTFSVQQLDHAATLGNSPLMIPSKQLVDTQAGNAQQH